MKNTLLLICCSLSFFTSCASCSKNSVDAGIRHEASNNHPTRSVHKMKIKIGNSTFTATLNDNATATAFKSMLPMTITMIELNGNEKYYDLPGSLPTNASNARTIRNGDLMIYGSNTLVLFYKSFTTSYNYTKIGRINDTTGLDTAVGSSNVKVTFELE